MSPDTDLKGAAQPLSKQRLRLWLKLLKASGMIEEEVRRRLRRDFDWTLPRFDVMSALHRHPDGLKMSEISRLLRVSNGNITGIVDKLTDEGLALRVSVAGDRRANLVRLTPKGREVFADHAAVHENWIDELLGSVGETGIDEMSGWLDELTNHLGEET